MKPYEKYKYSGIEWIGEIPEHWKVGKVKQLFKVGRGRVISTEDVNEKGKYPVFSSQTRDNGCIGYIDTYDYDYEQLTWTTDGANAGTIFLRNGKYNCTNVCGTLQLNNEKKYVLKYMYYFLDYVTFFYKRRDTNGFKIMNNEMKNIEVIAPYFSEQQQIANYLDKKTVEIDSVISDLELQLEKLETYRRELISKVVTKGLNQNIKMKDSGIDWIGEVPEHWEVVPLFSVADENKKKNTGMLSNNLLSLSYGQIIRKNIDTSYGLLPENFENYQIVNADYTILRLTDLQNDKKSLRSGYVKERGIITSAYVGLIPNTQINGRYFSCFLNVCDLRKVFYGLGSGLRQSLTFSELKRLPVLLPTYAEQEQIVESIEKDLNKIAILKSDITKQIENLKNYRKIIIRDAVTGKINVAKVE